ncbi:hypothetical protein MPTK1_2g15550 [Marchantia polymorpha subsp. ruderalis]|uniref:Uncharacterized protein n=1 Tax=Marchantia polymorpha TaxID=3197 RepID=A0A2R6WK26_MARPO|nr:hypothetical protein MARPO_0082s0052 [Marchantia polymorpha]BBN02460.1 hypothetical protein Mp_2g15550 [Marchantia polymorpha subsp. ruderalis]|eukprot:PTQ34208.1 hypothetical protein MARPO_0082s0052 [Marchantia polymorpha]
MYLDRWSKERVAVRKKGYFVSLVSFQQRRKDTCFWSRVPVLHKSSNGPIELGLLETPQFRQDFSTDLPV